jgi:hypothetical protein
MFEELTVKLSMILESHIKKKISRLSKIRSVQIAKKTKRE